MKEKGYLSLVLHAHLPYVRHPEQDHFLEEIWLYEAITETYIPLLRIFERLAEEDVQYTITMSLTPTLISMLTDPLLQERYIKHIEKLIHLANKEVDRTRWLPEIHPVALMYQEMFNKARYAFVERYNKNLVNAFKSLQDAGYLEMITAPATHGYLPLIDIVPEAVKAQIKIGVDTYEKNFGRKPKGIWLSECAYQPGHDRFLKEMGLRYFFTDTHGILNACPRPKYGIFAPIYCESGVAAFGRDVESSKQVWSAREGYPGDYDYREFYRDIGYDLDWEYLEAFTKAYNVRTFTGIKYNRITGSDSYKEYYIPERAMEKAALHAGNFMFNREKQVEYLSTLMDRPPIIVAPYDAELFGHWWFEGPNWLDFLIRKIHYDQNNIRLISPGEYLEMYPKNQISTPSMSSWGYKGYNEVWLEGSNDWIYRYLHKAAERMVELANTFPNADGLLQKALNQAARELLLAQSSDWAFIMKTNTMVPYAVKRTKDHVGRFTRLYEDIKSNNLNEDWINNIEDKDNIFPDLDYRIYSTSIV